MWALRRTGPRRRGRELPSSNSKGWEYSAAKPAATYNESSDTVSTPESEGIGVVLVPNGTSVHPTLGTEVRDRGVLIAKLIKYTYGGFLPPIMSFTLK